MALLRHSAAGGLLAALAAIRLVCPAAAQTPGPSPTLEDEIKAAYLHNFTTFVEWPPLAFASTSAPLVMCLAADATFARALERIIAGETIGRRPLRLVVLETDNVARCHVLFVGRGGRDRTSRLIAAADKVPVLTVSDAPRFLQQGGMILFVLDNGRVRFDVNLGAAERAGLKVSSKLLRVARRVSESGAVR